MIRSLKETGHALCKLVPSAFGRTGLFIALLWPEEFPSKISLVCPFLFSIIPRLTPVSEAVRATFPDLISGRALISRA